jgi:uncharacterized protein YjbI with pentapeptide repeats
VASGYILVIAYLLIYVKSSHALGVCEIDHGTHVKLCTPPVEAKGMHRNNARHATPSAPDLKGLSAKAVRERCAAYAQACTRAAREQAQEQLANRQRALRATLSWQQQWTHPEQRRTWLIVSTLLSIVVYAGLAWWVSSGLAWQRGNLAWVLVAVLAVLPLALWAWALRPAMSQDQQERHRATLKRCVQQARAHDAEMVRVEAVYQLQPYINGDYGPALASQSFKALLLLWRDTIALPANHADPMVDAAPKHHPSPLQRRTRSALARAIAHVCHGEHGEHWMIHSHALPNANANGWDAHQAHWSGLLWPQACLNAANLSHAQLAGAQWPQAQLSHADLSYTELHHADLCGANLDRAHLRRAHLSAARLRHADLQKVDASDAHAIACDLRDVQAAHSVWTRAKLSHARLNRAQLDGADLRQTQLTCADLRGAQLRGAQLQQADLCGARCVDAVIDERTQLQGARFDARTQFGHTDDQGQATGADVEKARWLGLGAIEVDASAAHWTEMR